MAAGYEAPFGINLSTLAQMHNGAPRQRTYQFRAVDPAGGPSLPSSSTIALPMEPYGATRIEAFSAFNSNVPWATGGGAGTGVARASPTRPGRRITS